MPEIISPTDRAHYTADLEAMRSANSVPAWLRDIRTKGAAEFAETRFPHYKDEAWRFTDVRPIVSTPFRSFVGGPAATVGQDAVSQYLYAEPDWPQLVFVDGFFDARLSKLPKPPGLIVLSLAAAARSHELSVREHLDKLIDHSSAFTKLNAAFLQDGAFVRAAKGVKLDVPIHCLFVSTGAKQAASYPRNLFIFDDSSECSLLETYVGLADSDYLVNGVTEIHVGPNSRVVRHKVVCETSASYHLDTTQVRIDRDARFDTFTVTLSGRIVRNELCVRFAGPGSECSLNGLYLNDGNRLIDNALYVDHDAPNCRSRMAYKGVLAGDSSAVFTGKVYVHRHAQKTDSNQLNNNLLLSDTAVIDTKPQLEIFADDVKCTHGATIGGFPRELLFYFQSRGMGGEKAHGILTYGFASEIVGQIAISPLRDWLNKLVYDKYTA